MTSVLERFVGCRDFPSGLLPADEAWPPIASAGPCVDIGAFEHPELRSRSTHTDLVQSAVGGYTRPALHRARGRALRMASVGVALLLHEVGVVAALKYSVLLGVAPLKIPSRFVGRGKE